VNEKMLCDALAKVEAEEEKLLRWLKESGKCSVCGMPLPYQNAQLAHVIPKHKKYIKKYGAAVIHHELNTRITCDKCNSSVLMDPATHPIEAEELVSLIRNVIKLDEELVK